MMLTVQEAAARWCDMLAANEGAAPIAIGAADAFRMGVRSGYLEACMDIYGEAFEEASIRMMEKLMADGRRRQQETTE